MASLKADKPVSSPPTVQVKKEPAKAPASKQAPAKPDPKPREPRRKPSGGAKPAAKK